MPSKCYFRAFDCILLLVKLCISRWNTLALLLFSFRPFWVTWLVYERFAVGWARDSVTVNYSLQAGYLKTFFKFCENLFSIFISVYEPFCDHHVDFLNFFRKHWFIRGITFSECSLTICWTEIAWITCVYRRLLLQRNYYFIQ